ncbi:bifunctional protein-serine/threonine kinase/phosphatase [Enterovibrio sp. ZSDZ35]|uniref:Bifunctional protein-serine/threonine kinase/phosphatase n=1 Tax=Enterovibrio qingdaonensis TaxID=2899818 RepID=A0ABT5QNZ8_9GAMM|nr:bifunctional protein-serine/threonine kinase/phosphatase [Enterovibrio sp. ZSDZ35]MDD1782709.1 bifunctional protein-serine/threonine kinase/phosphatase [Enterovibrio sp. ZSDZ35]
MKPENLSTSALSATPNTSTGEQYHVASQLVVHAGGYSIAGMKSPNQDAFAVCIPKKTHVLKHKGVVAAIADGVSSSNVSQKASEMSVTEFINDYLDTPATWKTRDAAGKVLRSLNQWLYHHGQHAGSASNAMVAAFGAVVIKSNTAHLFHAGDCRVYLFRQHVLKQITEDHRRYTHKETHYLTRALGIDSHLNVDYQSVGIEAGDWLLMTTDGIHDALSLEALTSLLNEAIAQTKAKPAKHQGEAKADLEAISRALTDAALDAGSDDNITCLLMSIDNVPPPTLDEALHDIDGRRIPSVLKEGQQIDHYRIARVIHSGSRSHIYLARSELDGKQYVLKMPSQNFADDPVYLSGFVQEGWIGEQIKQRGVMKIHPRSRHSPFLYHVCDYVDGVTLRQWMLDNPRPTLTEVRTLAKGTIRAMRVLQRMSVVHRDIKPDNLMVDKDLNVTLIDYGTAQAGGMGELAGQREESYVVGDLNYAAPEYLKGNAANTESDVFSLGVSIYEVLTGHLPCKEVNASNPNASARGDYVPATVYRPDIPDWFDVALKKACHPIPSARYKVLSEFEQDLKKPPVGFKTHQQSLPLIEKDPLTFWKGLSALLFVLVLVLAGLLVSR